MLDKDFVRIWLKAYKERIGLRAMCERYDIPYIEASQRASSLRRAGVKLPTMPKADQKRNVLETDVKALNNIIVEELGQEALGWRNR